MLSDFLLFRSCVYSYANQGVYTNYMHDPDLLFSFMVKPQNLKEGGSFLSSKHLGK